MRAGTPTPMPTPRPILSCEDKPDAEDCPLALVTGAELVAVLLLKAVVIIEVIVDIAVNPMRIPSLTFRLVTRCPTSWKENGKRLDRFLNRLGRHRKTEGGTEHRNHLCLQHFSLHQDFRA